MRKAILLCILSFLAMTLFARTITLSADCQRLEELYQKGDLNELGAKLLTVKAQNAEESALLLHLNALLKTRNTEVSALLRECLDRYPATYYGQKCMLELAKIHLLERESAQAKTLLQRITSLDILERYYWLAVCAETLDDHNLVIANCENYLRLAPQGQYLEEAYFLIAETYQNQGKYQSAISSLNKLQSIDGYPKAQQYFYYLLGLQQQLAKNPREALANYKKGLELNKLSQIAFQIEDKLFELKEKYPASVDLSFLYPYSELDLPQIGGTPPVPVISDTPPPQKTELKLTAKPSGGFFLQLGRFGVEANAHKLSYSIRQMELSANYFEDKNNKSVPWVVVSGPYQTKNEAEMVRQTLLEKDINCFITQF